MIETFFKYVLSCFVILATTYGQSHAYEEYNGISNESHFTTCLSSDSNVFINTFFASDTNSHENDSPITVIEKEVDVDETKSQKDKLGKTFSDVSIFNYRDAACVLSDINNELSSYSHFEESFECWYILYQVFQI